MISQRTVQAITQRVIATDTASRGSPFVTVRLTVAERNAFDRSPKLRRLLWQPLLKGEKEDVKVAEELVDQALRELLPKSYLGALRSRRLQTTDDHALIMLILGFGPVANDNGR